MLARILAILGALATVVAGVYAVLAYHFPIERKTEDNSLYQAKAAVSNAPRKLDYQINQQTWKDDSPNIIGSGNVVNSR